MLIRTILTTLILPPAIQIIFVLIGLLLWRLKRGLALLCFALSFVSLVVLSMPMSAAKLYQTLEIYPEIPLEQWSQYQGQPSTAVVVLAGGKRVAREYANGETIFPQALARVRYGALVAQKTGLPLLASGGGEVLEGTLSESELMAEAFSEYGLNQVMLERLSKNTWENAKYSADILQRENINRIILVTQSWHLRRAVYSFEQFGFEVVPAPTLARGTRPPKLGYLPTAYGFLDSVIAIREWLGLLTYAFIYDAPPQLDTDNPQ